MDEEIAKDLQKEENKRAGFSVQPVEEPFEANVEGEETGASFKAATLLWMKIFEKRRNLFGLRYSIYQLGVENQLLVLRRELKRDV